MALVQANGQTGLCRRFLGHLEDVFFVVDFGKFVEEIEWLKKGNGGGSSFFFFSQWEVLSGGR